MDHICVNMRLKFDIESDDMIKLFFVDYHMTHPKYVKECELDSIIGKQLPKPLTADN